MLNTNIVALFCAASLAKIGNSTSFEFNRVGNLEIYGDEIVGYSPDQKLIVKVNLKCYNR